MPNELINSITKKYPGTSLDDMLDWYEAASFYRTPLTAEAYGKWVASGEQYHSEA